MTWTVVGQDGAVGVLRGAIEHARVAHAYLFAGSSHVGKTLTALQFAQALNCDSDERPCGRCRSCERIAAGAHPDVEIIGIGGLCIEENEHNHAKDNSRDVRICQIRRIEKIASRAPFEGRHRVLIVDPADAMNQVTQNALLKTLEEPPPNVVIILIVEHEDHMLDTIRSRARRIAFTGAPLDLIERTLRTHWGVEPARAAALARLSGGRIGWAVLALNDERMMEKREAALDDVSDLAAATITARMAAANEMGSRYSKDRAAVHATLGVWQAWWRDILLIAAGREPQATHRERLDTLRPLAAQCDVAAAVRALRAITDARQQLEENASPALTLESMVLSWPQLRPNAVASRLSN